MSVVSIGLHGGGHLEATASSVDVSEVTPTVLAFGLSHVTRFGGQAGAYSVAEHECRMYDWAKAEKQDKAVLRAILIHDAPECLGEGDHMRNVKLLFGVGGLGVFAEMTCNALWSKFIPDERGPTIWPWALVHKQLKWYDEWIGCLEARAFGFPHGPVPDWLDTSFAPDPARLPWSPGVAQERFLERWEESQ